MIYDMFIDFQYLHYYNGMEWHGFEKPQQSELCYRISGNDLQRGFFNNHQIIGTLNISNPEEHNAITRMNSRANAHHENYAWEQRMRVRNFQIQLRLNLTDSRPLTRFVAHLVAPANFVAAKELCKRVSNLIRQYAVEEEYAVGCELVRQVNLAKHISYSLHNRLVDVVVNECSDLLGRTFVNCHDCTTLCFIEDDDRTRYVEYHDTYVCNSCLDRHYRYSDVMERHIPAGDCYPIYDSASDYRNDNPADFCTRDYGRENYYRFNAAYISDSDEYDELYNEENRVDDNYLPDYHGVSRDWREYNATKKYPSLGVELEVYAEDRSDFINNLRANFKIPSELFYERDGSLDSCCGIEVVTQPYGREEWEVMSKRLLGVCRDSNAYGYNEPAGSGYGIHVSISRDHLSPLAEARLLMFLTSEFNTQFVRAVAQRSQIYHADNGIGIGDLGKGSKVRSISGGIIEAHRAFRGRRVKKIYGRGKYTPMNLKDKVAEFRLFQSTVNHATFMKNLEFVWALYKWTLPESCTGHSYKHEDFLMWLNTPENRHEFPYLTDFLSKGVFYGTNIEPFVSPWKHLMVKPQEAHAVEPMAA